MKIRLLAALALLLSLPAMEAQQSKAKPKAGTYADWYQFRGPNRDGHSPDTGLLKEWPAGGPPLAWKATNLGEGYSSVCVVGNRVYTMGQTGNDTSLIALNSADGKLVWSVKIGPSGNPGNYNGPRSTPACDGTGVYAVGQLGDVVAVQAATGRPMWQTHLDRNLGGAVPQWGFSESPLLDGNFLVVTPGGGGGSVAALNKANGQPAWRSSQLKDPAHYTSIVPVEIDKVRQYLVFTPNTIAGLLPANGQTIWRADRRGETAVIPAPVYGNNIVFVSSGYGVGHNGFRVAGPGGRFQAQEIYKGKEITNHLGGLIAVGDHVYGVDDRGPLKCLELKTGKEVWAGGSFNKGALAFAEGMLYVRSQSGPISLVEASPEGFKQKGSFDQPDRSGKETWPHPVVFGGKLYLRDQGVLLCYDVKAK